MSEDHRIVSRARGEPLAAGSVGVRVRIQLSGYPSRRWTRDLGGCLTRELVGHAPVGHLRLNVNDIVQGNEIVLEGVEASEAPALAQALERAVDGANHATTDTPRPSSNVSQQEANDIAGRIALSQPEDS
jgi:hypothetical protein